MGKHLITWIVLADGSRARILRRREGQNGFETVAAFDSAAAHIPSHLLISSAPGRTQESANTTRHALAPRHDPHEEEMATFLRAVTDHLNQAAAASFDRLILFAPPRALGLIRDALGPIVQQKLWAMAPKDLTKLPIERLSEHLAALL